MYNNYEDFLNLKSTDITLNNLRNWFAFDKDGNQKFKPDQLIKLDDKILKEKDSKITLFKNYETKLKDKEIKLGRLIVNLFIYDIDTKTDLSENLENVNHINVLQLVNFIDEPFSKKVTGKANDQISSLFVYSFLDSYLISLINEVYIDKIAWLGYVFTPFIAPTLDLKTVAPNKEIIKFKDKVFKENQDVFDNNNVFEFDNMEKQILDFSSDQLNKENAQGKLFYDSGFKGDFSNNYKNSSLFRGVTAKSDNPLGLSIVKSNLLDGVAKEDLSAAMDVAVVGSLGRAIDTRLGGLNI
jgi:hypothetical protein